MPRQAHPLPIFLSIVLVVRNQCEQLQALLEEVGDLFAQSVNDYELIIVDNGSDDKSIACLKELTQEGRLPNLQVYALVQPVDADTAICIGLENALGDFTLVVDPRLDDVSFSLQMLEQSVSGADIVFAHNTNRPSRPILHRIGFYIYHALYRWSNGVHLARNSPPFRALSKRMAHFILQYSQPAVVYRSLPDTGGFQRVDLTYASSPKERPLVTFRENLNRGIQVLVSTTAPMRLVTALSLFGALANLGYSLYVVLIFFFKEDLQAGWASQSLQQSGMFFLFSLVFLVFGEYLLHMKKVSSDDPSYHVGLELTSATITRHEKLNLEDVASTPATSSFVVAPAHSKMA